jgi:predicted dehydrogenase
MIRQARYIVHSGEIGRIIRIVVEYTQGWLSSLIDDPGLFNTWHIDPDISGPSCTMMDVGIHALNLVQTITEGGLSWDQEYPETLEKLNPVGTSTVYKKGAEDLCAYAKRASNLPRGHPEGLICAFANIYRGGFNVIKCIENNEKPCKNGKAGWDYPNSDQGVVGLAFIEAIIKNNKSSKKWTVLEL